MGGMYFVHSVLSEANSYYATVKDMVRIRIKESEVMVNTWDYHIEILNNPLFKDEIILMNIKVNYMKEFIDDVLYVNNFFEFYINYIKSVQMNNDTTDYMLAVLNAASISVDNLKFVFIDTGNGDVLIGKRITWDDSNHYIRKELNHAFEVCKIRVKSEKQAKIYKDIIIDHINKSLEIAQ